MISDIELDLWLIGEKSNSVHTHLPYRLLVHQAFVMKHEPEGPPKHSLFFSGFFCEIKDCNLQAPLCRDSCHMCVISVELCE